MESSTRTFGSKTLLELFDGDREAVNDLLRVAVVTMERDVRLMESASERGEAAKIREAAHSLKGSSASIGCLRLAEICATIERAAVEGGTTIDPTPLESLHEAVDALIADIESFCQESAAGSASGR